MIRKPNKTLLRFVPTLFLIFILVGSSMTAGATDVAGLIEKEEQLQEELAKQQENLATLAGEIEELTVQIEKKAQDCQDASIALAEAQMHEDERYEAMQKRIQYMYEEGSTSLMGILLTAESMSDFLNKADFVSNITDYDRDMLDDLITIREDVAAKEAKLNREKAALEEAIAELDAKQIELTDLIASTSTDLEGVSAELVDARKAQAAAGGGVYIKGAVNLSQSEIITYATLLQAEAGGVNGEAMLAVATVVMNRVVDPRYAPNTVIGIIYQEGQFMPTWDGAMDRIMAAGGPTPLAVEIATASLNGLRHPSIIGIYQFRSAATTLHSGMNIGGNIYF